MIPVITTHYGGQDYLAVAMRQARQYNGRVVLLGDESNQHVDAEHHHFARYSERARQFEAHYVHMNNVTPHWFELHNLQEFFILKEFMEAQGLERVFLMDSDVMVYDDMDAWARRFPQPVSCVVPFKTHEYQWTATAGTSYWSLDGLSDYCDFIWRMYATEEGRAKLEEKWNWHQSTGAGGGLCDMSLLYLFIQERPGEVGNLIAEIVDGAVFDVHILTAEGLGPHDWEMEDVPGMPGPSKKLQWRSGQPYGHHLPTDRWIRLLTLHFQDGSKSKMKEYYREKP